MNSINFDGSPLSYSHVRIKVLCLLSGGPQFALEQGRLVI